MTIRPPEPPKPPAGPAGPAVPAKPKPTQAVVTATLPSGEAVTGVVRTPTGNLKERAIKTLGQAFLSTFSAAFFGAQALGITALRSAIIAAGSAAGAALLSLVQNHFFGGGKA